MRRVYKDEEKTVSNVRKTAFLLSDLYKPGKNRSQYKRVYHEFRNLLLQLKEYIDNESQLMMYKNELLKNFKTIIRVWENESTEKIAQEIKALRIDSKYGFLIYKTSFGWKIKGANISGHSIDDLIDKIPEHSFANKHLLLEMLRDISSNKELITTDPLHKLVVEYFGYYRPSIFISYSWPGSEYPDTFEQDAKNKYRILKLVKDLKAAGFRVLIDKDDLTRVDNLSRFIDIIDGKETDYICVMGTPLYKNKYDRPILFMGGESNKTYVEAKAIIERTNTSLDFEQRTVTLLIDGEKNDSLPTQLKSKIFCKFSHNDYFDTFLSLFFTLYRYKDPMKNKIIKNMIKEFYSKIRPIEEARESGQLQGVQGQTIVPDSEPRNFTESTKKDMSYCFKYSPFLISAIFGDFICFSRRIRLLFTTKSDTDANSALKKLLRDNIHLKNVRFSNNILGVKEFEQLESFLFNTTVEKVEFDSTNVVLGMGRANVANRWHNFMREHPAVRELILYPEESLSQPKTHVLKLTPAELTTPLGLIRYLSNVNRCVTSLRIEGFDSASLLTLLRPNDVVELLCEHPSLRDITFFNITLDDRYDEQLMAMIPRLLCPNLESLAIENCGLRNFHLLNLLSDLVSQNMTLSKLSLANNRGVLNNLDSTTWMGIAKLQLKKLNLTNTFDPKLAYSMTKKTFHLIANDGLEVLDISRNGGVRIEELPSLFKVIFNATHLKALYINDMLYPSDSRGSTQLGFNIIANISRHPENNLSRLETLSICGFRINDSDSFRLSQLLQNSRFYRLSTFRISSVYHSNCTNFVPLNLSEVQTLRDICFSSAERAGAASCGGVYYSLFMECPSHLFSPNNNFDVKDHAAFVAISHMPTFAINFDSNRDCLNGFGRITNNITIASRWSFYEFGWFQKLVSWWGRPIFRFEQFNGEHSVSFLELEEFPYICKYTNLTQDNVYSSRFDSSDSARALEDARTYAIDCPTPVNNTMISKNAIILVKDVSILRGFSDGLFQNKLFSELVFILGSIAPLLHASYYNVSSSYDLYSITPFLFIPLSFRLISTFYLLRADQSLPRIAMTLLPLPIYCYRVYKEGLWSIFTGLLTGAIFQQAAYTFVNDTKRFINEESSRKVSRQEYFFNIITVPLMCAHESVSPRTNITDGLLRCGLFATSVFHGYLGPSSVEKKPKQRNCLMQCTIL